MFPDEDSTAEVFRLYWNSTVLYIHDFIAVHFLSKPTPLPERLVDGVIHNVTEFDKEETPKLMKEKVKTTYDESKNKIQDKLKNQQEKGKAELDTLKIKMTETQSGIKQRMNYIKDKTLPVRPPKTNEDETLIKPENDEDEVEIKELTTTDGVPFSEKAKVIFLRSYNASKEYLTYSYHTLVKKGKEAQEKRKASAELQKQQQKQEETEVEPKEKKN